MSFLFLDHNKDMKKLLLILVLLLISCQNQPQQTQDYSDLLQYKQPYLLPEPLEDFLIESPDINQIDELVQMSQYPNKAFNQTKEEALEDLEQLEWMFKHFYGLYPVYQKQYDQAFVSLKNSINKQQTISRLDFLAMLRSHFSFDQNNHLIFDGQKPAYHSLNFYDFETAYKKEKDQYLNTLTNEVYRGEEDLVPFLTQDLDVVYYETNNVNTPKKTYEERLGKKTLDLPNDILYVHQDEIMETNINFDKFAIEFRKNGGIAVLDLRNNAGGLENYPGIFFFHLTQEKPQTSNSGFYRRNPMTVSPEEIQYFRQSNWLFENGNHFIYKPQDEMIHQEGLLIVLQNQYTFSGAEKMIDMLHHLDNTIFIGTPSGGVLTSNIDMKPAYLRNSGISVQFGGAYFNFHPDYFKENSGFKPDLYVLDIHMQETIESLIHKMTLK